MRVLVAEDDNRAAQTMPGARAARERLRRRRRGGRRGSHPFPGRNYEYELAVLDWRMPGMSGLDVVRWIRRQQRPTRRCLLLTGTRRARRPGYEDALSEGADDYLVKPFDFAELLARMRALQRRPATVQQPAIVVGDLRFDPSEKTGAGGRPPAGPDLHRVRHTRASRAQVAHGRAAPVRIARACVG